MGPIPEPALLALWERGRRQRPRPRALTLLGVRLPHIAGAALADLPIGRRNAELLALYRECCGRDLGCCVQCPACAERFEFDFDTDGIAAMAAPTDEPLRAQLGDWDLEYRLPSSRDLAYVQSARSVADGARILFERCLRSARRCGGAAQEPIPEAIIDALGERIAASDPLAEVLLDLQCPDCGHPWQADVDIAEFLWRELAARAQRLLMEIHTLATQYGWTEQVILAMGAERRQSYMEMVVR